MRFGVRKVNEPQSEQSPNKALNRSGGQRVFRIPSFLAAARLAWTLGGRGNNQHPFYNEVRITMNRIQRRRLMPYLAVSLAFAISLSEAAAQPQLRDVYEIAHTSFVLDIKFSPDSNQLLSAGDDGNLKVWEVRTGKKLAAFTDVSSVVLSPDGKTFCKGRIGGTKEPSTLWDISSRKVARSLATEPEEYYPVTFSPDGQTLACKSSNNINPGIMLWKIGTGKTTVTCKFINDAGTPDNVFFPISVAFSPDGKTLAAGGQISEWGSRIKLWEVATGKVIANLNDHREMVNSVAFSPDGKTLASASNDKSIILWDVATHKNTETLLAPSEVWCVAFSPGGKLLASCGGYGDHIVRLWDIDTGRTIAKLPGHTKDIRTVAFSPDGKLLASGSNDQSIRLWDV